MFVMGPFPVDLVIRKRKIIVERLAAVFNTSLGSVEGRRRQLSFVRPENHASAVGGVGESSSSPARPTFGEQMAQIEK